MGTDLVGHMALNSFFNYVAYQSEVCFKSGLSVVLARQSFNRTQLASSAPLQPHFQRTLLSRPDLLSTEFEITSSAVALLSQNNVYWHVQ